MILQNYMDPENQESGLSELLWLAPFSFFAEGGIKAPAPPYLFAGAEVMILDSHIMEPGKGFIQILLAQDKNKFDAKCTGDKGFQILQKELNCIIPGSYAEQHELMKNVLNIPLIALIKDINCPANMYYQLGTACIAAYLSTDFTTGTTKEGIKGYNAILTSTLGYVQLYAGDIIGINPIDDSTFLVTEADEDILTEDDQQILTE